MNALEIDLNLFKVLDVLFEEQSVSQAAVRLKVSQPAVSAALRRLRRQFDDELFIRSAGGIVPTKFAETLREPVRRAISVLESEVLMTRQFQPTTAEVAFRVATSDIGEAILFPQLHRHFEEFAPNCTISNVSLPPEMLARAMAQGDVDLAVGYFPDLAANGIHERQLSRMSLGCLAREGHPLAGKSIDLETFLGLGHIVVSHETRQIDAYEQFVADKGWQRDVKAQLGSMTSLPPLIGATDLVAIAPLALASWFAGLAEIHLPVELPQVAVKIYWHHRSHDDDASAWLRSCIASINEANLASPGY